MMRISKNSAAQSPATVGPFPPKGNVWVETTLIQNRRKGQGPNGCCQSDDRKFNLPSRQSR